MIELNENTFIDESELLFKASRSSGPGGQNVNKLNTRITLFFDVANCNAFTDQQKRRILSRLRTRADKNGVLRVVSQRHRSQRANRDAAVERLRELLADVLRPRTVRKKTRVPRGVIEKRLIEKKKRGLLKKQRASKSRSGDCDD